MKDYLLDREGMKNGGEISQAFGMNFLTIYLVFIALQPLQLLCIYGLML